MNTCPDGMIKYQWMGEEITEGQFAKRLFEVGGSCMMAPVPVWGELRDGTPYIKGYCGGIIKTDGKKLWTK